jgi:hypothetical protein
MRQSDALAAHLKDRLETDSNLWCTRHFPTELSDVPLCRKSQTEKFMRILHRSFEGPPRHPRIVTIAGPVGCGKSTLLKVACATQNIEILLFSPDDKFDNRPITVPDSIFLYSFKNFLERGQFVTEPGIRRILLVDDLDIDHSELSAFIEVTERYGSDSRRLFPLFWIVDPQISKRPRNAVVFNIPSASHTVLKRVITKVTAEEGIHLNSAEIEDLIADNPGDVRLAVNQLQFTRGFPAGAYEPLTFFQAVGEILYNKRRLSSEQILRLSHSPPKQMITALFENALEFLGDSEDFAEIADYLSEADLFLGKSWEEPELAEVAATTAMRAFVVANRHPQANTFWALRSSRMSRSRWTFVEPDAPFVCWPDPGMSAGEMDFRLFMTDSGPEFTGRSERAHEEFQMSQQELLEAMELLEIDPIED